MTKVQDRKLFIHHVVSVLLDSVILNLFWTKPIWVKITEAFSFYITLLSSYVYYTYLYVYFSIDVDKSTCFGYNATMTVVVAFKRVHWTLYRICADRYYFTGACGQWAAAGGVGQRCGARGARATCSWASRVSGRAAATATCTWYVSIVLKLQSLVKKGASDIFTKMSYVYRLDQEIKANLPLFFFSMWVRYGVTVREKDVSTNTFMAKL